MTSAKFSLNPSCVPLPHIFPRLLSKTSFYGTQSCCVKHDCLKLDCVCSAKVVDDAKCCLQCVVDCKTAGFDQATADHAIDGKSTPPEMCFFFLLLTQRLSNFQTSRKPVRQLATQSMAASTEGLLNSSGVPNGVTGVPHLTLLLHHQPFLPSFFFRPWTSVTF
jgi:hypothetical protein